MRNRVGFDCYEADLASGELYKRGVRIPLRDKSFAVLAALLERPGELVSREELHHRLWHDDVFVDFENNLNTAVGRLRQALSESAEHPHFIETLPRRGYRFLLEVHPVCFQPPAVGLTGAKLLVLPFINQSGDPGEEYFSDAITDEIITALAAYPLDRTRVIARSTAMHYKGSKKSVLQIGRELGIEYVVEGAVLRTGNEVALNVQLVQVWDQVHLFAAKYKTLPGDLFDLYERIASDLATSMGFRAQPHRIRHAPSDARATRNLAAYNEYLQARFVLGRTTPDALDKAKQHLEAAIGSDPNFSLAYDALAEVYWYLGYMGIMRPREAFASGIIHALRAVELDNSRAETHALLAQFHKTMEYNWNEVQREMELALRLDPASPLVRVRHAVSWLMPQGRMAEAIAEVEYALQWDPLSLFYRTWHALMLLIADQHDRAQEAARHLLELDANAYWAYLTLGSIFRDRSMYDQAISAYRKAIALSGGAPHTLGWLGLTLGLSGNALEAQALLQQLETQAAQRYVPPTSFAWIYLGLGDLDGAFLWLDRAVDECDQLLMAIKTFTFLDRIRSDARFVSLLRKMHLQS